MSSIDRVIQCLKMDPLLSNLENELILLTLTLYNNPVVPRNIVQYFLSSTHNLIFKAQLPIVLAKIKLIHNIDEAVLEEIKDIFASTQDIFYKFKTEHRRFKLYKEKGLMIEPSKCIFGKKL